MAKENVWLLGCGDIGSRLASRLARQAYSCHGVRRNPTANNDAIHWHRADITDETAVASLLRQGADVVVATMTPAAMTEDGYRRGYVDSARALACVIRALPRPPRLLQWVSSTRVYGNAGGDWLDESAKPAPSGFQGRLLLEAEQTVRELPCPSVVVRFSGIYGPGRERLLNQVRAGRCAAPEPVQYGNRIHADDCAGFLAHLIERQRYGQELAPIYNASDNAPAPLHEVHAWLAQQLGVECVEVMPPGTRGGKRLSNERMRRSGYSLKYPDYRAGYAALL
ncbi:SDR family oxidoreductase [Biformimicrobium ophioploci]|uniref:SDR family oxidoreductase n=1 Tax=Biformimicrobium ophioploci TaxID=3036711 RepID=A0ABQ6LVM6_9GAMM|nr:SDR family oxidoreductase [Microbulbifer sp. NKW57]GMG86106.1 SDR family oxidoreductase [Microbulbifer sp. NKW57]